ncbi:adenosine receptor A2b-like [Actinia tenebrosa]|uniref:Adenosine receptor A2b-like n=1 Tax=Actinia tenebrosa TaxID=6105 RepID=A0A6P8IG73_ACTTE|nr:adenosine receptor A2b-like [Actinia tenebrosa]
MNQTEYPDNISYVVSCGSLPCRATLIAKYIGITNTVMIVPTAAANALVIVAILTTSSLRTPSYLLLSSLAFSDLAVGLVIQPILAVLAFWVAYSHTLPSRLQKARLVITELLFFSVAFITTAISVDRYLAIRLKMQYRSVVTIPRTRRLLLLIWVASSVTVFAINMSNFFVCVVFFIICVTICLLIILVSYTMSFRALKIHCARTQPQGNLQPNSTTQSNVIDVLKYREVLKTMIILVLLIVVFSLLFYAIVFIFLEKNDGYVLIIWILTNVSYLNSIMNPVICMVRMRDLRRACRNVLRRLLPACWK